MLTQALRKFDYEVFLDSESLQAGSNWQNILSKSIKKTDVFLVLLTENSITSQSVISEIGAARAYIDSSSQEKLFIPILMGTVDIPLVIQDIQAIIIENKQSIDEAAAKIRGAIDALLGRKLANEEKRIERKEQIERTAANYIEEAIQELKERESSLETKANRWNMIGWCSLITGVFSAIILVLLTLTTTGGAVKSWPEFSFLAIKSIIIVALLIASAKYAFSLAKSFMSEALKNSDRIHAISFGKFFLQAFGDKVDENEVKEIFQHWNINNKSSFSELDAEKFDPKIVEAILSVAEVVKTSKTK